MACFHSVSYYHQDWPCWVNSIFLLFANFNVNIVKQKEDLHLDLSSYLSICLFLSINHPILFFDAFQSNWKTFLHFPLNISACISLTRKSPWNRSALWVFWLQSSPQFPDSILTSVSDLDWKGSLIYKVDRIKSPETSVVVPTCWARCDLVRVMRVTVLKEPTHLAYSQVGWEHREVITFSWVWAVLSP